MSTVQGLGWGGLKNGELLARAPGRIDVFITLDANLPFQQRLGGLPFGVIVLRAKSSRMVDLLPLVDKILATMAVVRPGVVEIVGG